MYKVLIVDDESVIVDGLTKIVPWEKYSTEVVGSAFDSKTATELIRKFAPDILFTDIHLPDENGLSMLAGIRSEFPDMQITVLTGYRDFGYAQEAIKLGVTRLLLKPSKMDEIEEALATMTVTLGKINPKKDTSAGKTEGTNEVAGSYVTRQAVAYIEKHCAEKISLADVAEHCYISQWHLSKLLNKFENQNFYDVLNGARIAKAKNLMGDLSLRISDIAALVGYVDSAHFSRIFKKIEGISAHEYRNGL